MGIDGHRWAATVNRHGRFFNRRSTSIFVAEKKQKVPYQETPSIIRIILSITDLYKSPPIIITIL